MSADLELLKHLLRPAGGGIHVVSTGVKEQQELQKRIYQVQQTSEIKKKWMQSLEQVHKAKVIVLGVPTDVGAGFTRGANRGPEEIRKAFLADPTHPYHHSEVIDVGDVFVVPQLLSDEMLSSHQKAMTHRELYGQDPLASGLPVSVLDMCAKALSLLKGLNPDMCPIVLGGDHSVAWPAFSSLYGSCSDEEKKKIGLLHFDAHTDLLEHRLGIQYCFATWAWHANALLGNDGRLVQVGLRASGHDRGHWESLYRIRQYWAKDVLHRSAAEVAGEIQAYFQSLGVTSLYISNDIDGTSEEYAAATGTPEAEGLHPSFVRELTQTLCRSFSFVGGDLVEVAPPLAGDRPGEPAKTLKTASAYLEDFISAGLLI
jgi:arginase family enzyme